MARAQRLTRRFPARMTEVGYRRLKAFAEEIGLDEGEALSFLFENFDSVVDPALLGRRLGLYRSMLEKRAASDDAE